MPIPTSPFTDAEIAYLLMLVSFDNRTNASFLRNTAPEQFPNQRREAFAHMQLADSVICKLKPPN